MSKDRSALASPRAGASGTALPAEPNLDWATVRGFGEEWRQYDQAKLSDSELAQLFDKYFAIFPWERLSPDAVGFDAGCGSGRWARLVAPRVGQLYCIDASEVALGVARRNLQDLPGCSFLHASVDQIPLPDGSMDFGYSLGVLHHVPDPENGIRSCVAKLKPGAPLLLYLYYAFDNRPQWFRTLWKASDVVRRVIARLPRGLRVGITQLIAAFVYWPLANLSAIAERLGFDVRSFPLSFYRGLSFYTMKTDALDRFGTPLERRFSADEIRSMMERAGLTDIRFYDDVPYWCAVGFRRAEG